MKRALLSGLAALTIAGCSTDSVKSRDNILNPVESPEVEYVSVSDYYENTGDLDGAMEMSSEIMGDISALEDVINKKSAKVATNLDDKGYIIVDSNSNPDFNNDHKVNFSDFFSFVDNFNKTDEKSMKYDLNNDGTVNFPDFFKFVDYFNKEVNSAPIFLNDLNPKEVNIKLGEEVKLVADTYDFEGDHVFHDWKNGSELIEVNGGNLIWTPEEVGEYDVNVRLFDEHGATGIEELSSRVFVEPNGPELNLPDKIVINQYESGRNGGEFSLNWKEAVNDPNFSDDELEVKVDIEDNEHTNHFYTYPALETRIEGDSLIFNPLRGFNSSDYGVKEAEVFVTNPDGNSTSKKVEVEVIRDNTFDTLYGEVILGEQWDKENPYTAFYIIDKVRVSGDSPDPDLWTGPNLSEDEKNEFEEFINAIPDVSPVVNSPLEIVYVNEEEASEKIYHPDKSPIIRPPNYKIFLSFDRSRLMSSAPVGPDPIYTRGEILLGTGYDGFPTLWHEQSHIDGFRHPPFKVLAEIGLGEWPEEGGFDAYTVFSDASRLTYPSDLDLAIWESRYE